jgi:hypothetical protein
MVPVVLVVPAASARMVVRYAAFAMVHFRHAIVMRMAAVRMMMHAAAPLPVRPVLGFDPTHLADIL